MAQILHVWMSGQACGLLEWQEANEVLAAILAKQPPVPSVEMSECPRTSPPWQPTDHLNNQGGLVILRFMRKEEA